MNRPYPRIDRALAQVDRGRLPAQPAPTLAETFAYLRSDEHRARMRAIGVAVGDVLNRMSRAPVDVGGPR